IRRNFVLKLNVVSCEIGSVPFYKEGLMAKLVLKTNKAEQKPSHWILILDGSGSMHWALKQLSRDTIGFVQSLPEQDFVSVILFSGHKQTEMISRSVKCTAAGKKQVIGEI